MTYGTDIVAASRGARAELQLNNKPVPARPLECPNLHSMQTTGWGKSPDSRERMKPLAGRHWIHAKGGEGVTKRCNLRLILLVSLLAGITSFSGCSGRRPSTSFGPATSSVMETATSDVVAASAETTTATAPGAEARRTFAVIGDYGTDQRGAREVAAMVASRRPEFVITTGDNYYMEAAGTQTGRYDNSAGAYYGAWMKDISTTGSRYPVGTAAINSFFPSLGNHDYSDAKSAVNDYLAYFCLPGAGFANTSGSERYYEFVQGPVHFFALDSNAEEPDGTSSTSRQAQWLQQQLAASTSPWNIVYFHHSPFSSDSFHGSTRRMQWPFAEWGADAVISGHAHTYERISRDGIVYFVNGLGGGERREFGSPVAGSMVSYNSDWGAQIVTATNTTLDFEFFNASGELVDGWRLFATPSPGN